jgi:hypothetical protein
MPLPPPPTNRPPVTSRLLLYRPGARSNLLAAERAVQFASNKLRGRSSNRSEDIVHILQRNLRNRYAKLPSDLAAERFRDDLSSLGQIRI